MKKNTLVFLFFLVKNLCFAQNFVVEAELMNVFYAGIDNPFHLAVENVPSEDLEVKTLEGTIRKVKPDSNAFIINTKKKGKIILDIYQKGEKIEEKVYRVKRIPDPYPFIIPARRSQIGSGNFKSATGLRAYFENFDFDAKCPIVSFDFTYLAHRANPIRLVNIGGDFSPEILGYVKKSKPRDTFYFDDIKCKCDGEDINRNIGSMVFVIQ
jgi:hypothetical protein